jgi:hypothetical protein
MATKAVNVGFTTVVVVVERVVADGRPLVTVRISTINGSPNPMFCRAARSTWSSVPVIPAVKVSASQND